MREIKMRLSQITAGLAMAFSLSSSASKAASAVNDFGLLFPNQTAPKNKPNRISQKKRRLNKRRLGYANNLKGKLNKADAAYALAIAKAKTEAIQPEKKWAQQQLKAEQNAIEKIKAANVDADSANTAANSLSKQLDKAKRNMPTASKETIIEYIAIGSDVLEHCVVEYRTMAKAADAERIDKERLGEAWPE